MGCVRFYLAPKWTMVHKSLAKQSLRSGTFLAEFCKNSFHSNS